MAERNLAIKILINAKDQASSAIAKLTKGLAGVAAGITAVVTAGAAWIGTQLFGDSIREAQALEQQMAKLRGAVEATGGAAGLTADEINAMAERLGEATLGSDDAFRDAAASLLTFKSVGADVFETVLERAQDLADVGFGSLQSNAAMLGKALEDPQRGLTALTRAGVTFTEGQREVIDSLAKAGNAAGAQAVILEAVAGQVGGVARTMGSGLSGAVDLVAQRFGDLKEQLGEAMIPVLTGINQRIADLYGRMRDSGVISKLGSAIATMAEQAARAVEDLISRANFDALLTSVKGFAEGTEERLKTWGANLAAVSEGASRTIAAAQAAWSGFRQAVELAAAGIVGAMAVLARGWALAVEGASKVGLASEEAVGRAQVAYESLADTARAYRDASIQHWADAKEAASRALGATAQQATTTAAAVETAAQQVGLSVEAFEALGEGASYAAEGQQALTQASVAAVPATQAAAQALGAQVDATLRLVEARKADMQAVEQATQLADREAELRVQRLRNLQQEAEARGSTIRAAQLANQVAREEVKAAAEAAAGALQRAQAAALVAQALREQAAATGDTTAETQSAIAAAEASAATLAVEAKAAEEAARSTRAMAAAKREGAAASEADAKASEAAAAKAAQAAEANKQEAQSALNLTGAVRANYAALSERAAEYFDRQMANVQSIKEWWTVLSDQEFARVKARYDEAGAAVERMTQRIQEGRASAADLYQAEAMARSGLDILDDEDLSGLRSAIASARAEMQSFTESAQDGLAALRQEWAQLQGDQVAVEQLKAQQRRLELEEQITEAQRSGNREALAALQEQLVLLNQISAKRVADAKADQQQKAEEKPAAPVATPTPVAPPPVRTVRVELKLGGRTTPIDVREGQEDDLLEAIRRAGLAA